MTELERLAEALDQAIWEMGEGMSGMPDADLWQRAHPRLLSVGELCAHVATAELGYFLGDAGLTSLASPDVSYYPRNVVHEVVLNLTSDEVWAEVQRVHAACRAAVLALAPDLDSENPYREGWTWRYALQYQAFHVAYHTGQIYAVRHLMGHETVDN